tara:strand:+ start:5284 stop:5544 length:261 start_codon:yes stop_codon:yes gene_type:complete
MAKGDRSDLEGQDVGSQESKASKRGIFSLHKWCSINGYPGVTRECIDSAGQSNDPKIIEMAKKALLQDIASTKKRRSTNGNQPKYR